MKTLIFLISLISASSFAGYQNCPQGFVEKNPKIYNLLKILEGPSKLGSCGLEVHICDRRQAEGIDNMVGDIMIVYMHQPIYIPLYIDQLSSGSDSTLGVHQQSVNYTFSDSNDDPYAGKNERDGLQFIFDDSGVLQQLFVKKSNKRDFTKLLFWKLAKSVECLRPN